MERITEQYLAGMVDRLNRLTGSPVETWTKRADGKGAMANVGNYHLDHAYGGVNLCRVVNQSGGVTNPIGGGFCTKRELYDKLHAFIRGIETAKGAN